MIDCNEFGITRPAAKGRVLRPRPLCSLDQATAPALIFFLRRYECRLQTIALETRFH